jgi:hypothetical protein
MRRLPPLQRLTAIALIAVFLTGCGTLPTPSTLLTAINGQTPPGSPGTEATPVTDLATVDSVEIRILESFPVQVQAVIRGSLPDGCTQIDQIAQTREGNAFSVTIATIRPADAICTQVLALFEKVIPLDVAGLSDGVYTVLVNGVSASFELTGGQTISDPAHDYSMVVPSEWEACTTTEYSRVYCAPQSEPGAPGFPVFYVSVIPAGFTNDQGSVYNFMSEEVIRSVLTLPVGEALATDDPSAEYSTFTRLPDVTILGEAWAVIENTRVWEGGPDTKDRRLIARRDDRTCVVGTYYETQADLDIFASVLATLAFTQ